MRMRETAQNDQKKGMEENPKPQSKHLGVAAKNLACFSYNPIGIT
jgi:hypothetical protein